MTTTVLVLASASLAVGAFATTALLSGTTSIPVTAFTGLSGVIYAITALLLPLRPSIVRGLALLHLGAGLAVVAISWIFIPTVWVVHGPLPGRFVAGFLLVQALLLPYFVVFPAAVLYATGIARRVLVRAIAVTAAGVSCAATLLAVLHARGLFFPALLPLGLVPGRDAIVATLDGVTVRVATTELTRMRAYSDATELLSLLSRTLSVDPDAVATRATLRRARAAPETSDVPLTPANVDQALREAAGYLVRNIGPEGRFRYLVDAPSNHETHEYNWPRHGGTTWALSALAERLDDPAARAAAQRAAGYLRTVLVPCGPERCIASGSGNADLGSSALGLLAFQAVGMHDEATALASFLRSQARPDGELMHEHDRVRGVAVDVERPYYTGEAALALARTGDPRDALVARRAVAYLARRWSFFGSRYWYDEEHWTCQAAAALHDDAGLALCRRWLAVQARLEAGDAPFDVDGAYGLAAFAPPAITSTASRTEGALAFLETRADHDLDAWVQRSLAFLLRRQLRVLGPLVAAQARGGFPASETDLDVRIDQVQHAALALLRWRVRDRTR